VGGSTLEGPKLSVPPPTLPKELGVKMLGELYVTH